MRKRELVHFHALLDRVRWFVGERGDLPDDTLDEYEDLDVAPTAVYRSKQAHEDAVLTLTESLAAAVEAAAESGEDPDDRPRDEEHRQDDGLSPDDRPASAHGD